MSASGRYGIDLMWIPLGAGGWFIRFNGRVWEALQAGREKRDSSDLYHSALEVHVPDGRYVVENAWPIPDLQGASRGVVAEGPVFSQCLAQFRVFRYEVRCWPDGTIYDASWAVGGPRRITEDVHTAQRVLDVLPSTPSHVWGRRVPGANDMWNSNSTISWVLTRSGVEAEALSPPPGGRAPGWDAGIHAASTEMDARR